MSDFSSSVSEIVTSLMTMFGTISLSLISNKIFMILISVIVLSILFSFVYSLTHKLKGNSNSSNILTSKNPFKKHYTEKSDIGWKFNGEYEEQVSISERRHYLYTHGMKWEAKNMTDDEIIDCDFPGLDMSQEEYDKMMSDINDYL